MKNTLEYKILKFLSYKNNGRFIDITEIEIDTDFLKSVICDLKGKALILTEQYPAESCKNSFIGFQPSKKPEKCKINTNGLDYLDRLEKSEVEFELTKRILEEFPKTKWFARLGFIIAILLVLKELYVLLWK